MKKLPIAKRNQLIMVLLGAVGLIALVYSILIEPQNEQNLKLNAKINTEAARLKQMKTEIKLMDDVSNKLAVLEQQRNVEEQDVVSGDIYAWTYDTLRHFNKSSYHVDIPNLSQPTVSDVDLIPDFPYRQAKFNITGTALYQDLGKFVADFENKFPHIRLNNLTIEPANTPGGGAERLDFRMDIIALTRPTQ
jgi:hypothetical protein